MVGQDAAGVAKLSWARLAVRFQIIILPQAKRDAREIDEFLAAQDPAVADRFLENLQSTLELQASIPTLGSPWISQNPATASLRWTRVRAFTKYVIFLRVIGSVMEVVRIIHGARDLDELLGS